MTKILLPKKPFTDTCRQCPIRLITLVFGTLVFVTIFTSDLAAKTSDLAAVNSAQAAEAVQNGQAAKPASSAKDLFLALILASEPDKITQALTDIEANWQLPHVPMALEAYAYTSSPLVREKLAKLLTRIISTKKDQSLHDAIDLSDSLEATGLNEVYQWVWNQSFQQDPGYADFKADLYRLIDPRFEAYFRQRQSTARIRLDEIRWGGVRQDGIPPLRRPQMISADQADYLEDDHIVFGIAINGDARAYPKRILAWHEMFTDTIGGVAIAGVYCTLCGTVIPYRTNVNGEDYALGTSGFLYRSNKLMYDQKTQSLWSTQRGEPVLGPLADKGITLPFESVVTTTWSEWRNRHPDTSVLSVNTGHQRNYAEGAAYAAYFASDKLMFATPFNDDRLANKQEILALRFPAAPDEQLAIDTGFLVKNPVYNNHIGRQPFVVFTDTSGANRVYDPEGVNFVTYDGGQQASDEKGNQWRVTEEWLAGPKGQKLPRLPYHRAFWFGWHAAFPNTRLIK